MASTLLLDTVAWDLALDTAGNIAVATEPYALAQDAASAIKLFAGELYYDTTQGIPYLAQILGQFPSLSLMRAYWEQAALTVPGIMSAQVYFSSWSDREVTGQVQVTSRDTTVAMNVGVSP